MTPDRLGRGLTYGSRLPDFSEPYRSSSKISHRAWFSPEEYKQLYEATRKRAQEPKKKGFNWEAEQLHDTSYSPIIPDCSPTRHGAFSSGMSRLLMTRIWARQSLRLKCAESMASDIATVCLMQ